MKSFDAGEPLSLFPKESLRVLSELVSIVRMRDHPADLKNMTGNNVREEQKISPEARRSPSQIERDTARGLSLEQGLIDTGEYIRSTPIVEDSRKLSFHALKHDLLHLSTGFLIEAKTMSINWDKWYLSYKQYFSTVQSTNHSDLFAIGVSIPVGPPDDYIFRVSIRFVVDSRSLSRYLVRGTGYSPYEFDHAAAVDAGVCVDLRSFHAKESGYGKPEGSVQTLPASA
jgi:hypothetical protein